MIGGPCGSTDSVGNPCNQTPLLIFLFRLALAKRPSSVLVVSWGACFSGGTLSPANDAAGEPVSQALGKQERGRCQLARAIGESERFDT